MERTEFLARRKSGIGGSDVAAILGISPWKTPYQVWLDKTGQMPEQVETAAQHFGTVLEDVVANEFAERNGVKVQRRNQMYRHPEHTELVANIDRYVVGGAILECKTSNAFDASKWGETGTDEVPDYYLTQVTHYMYVCSITQSYLAALIGGNDYRDYKIGFDSVLAEYQARKCVDFWQNHVLANVPPETILQDYKNLAEIYPARQGEEIMADAIILDKITELAYLRKNLKESEEREIQLLFEIKNFMAHKEILKDENGKVIATWKQQKDREKENIDWFNLVKKHGILETEIKDFTTVETKPGNRAFLLKVKL